MKKAVVIVFYVVVSVVMALEAIATLVAINNRDLLWVACGAGAVISGIIAYALGGKVFGDLAKEKEEDYDE